MSADYSLTSNGRYRISSESLNVVGNSVAYALTDLGLVRCVSSRRPFLQCMVDRGPITIRVPTCFRIALSRLLVQNHIQVRSSRFNRPAFLNVGNFDGRNMQVWSRQRRSISSRRTTSSRLSGNADRRHSTGRNESHTRSEKSPCRCPESAGTSPRLSSRQTVLSSGRPASCR